MSRVRRLLDLADGRSESVGESRSRALFVRDQLPLPDLQATLHSDGGIRLGRVDFLLDGVVGEFDGRVKYGRLVSDGERPSDVLWAEKGREDAIRDAGRQVVRWTWDELTTPGVVADRVRRAVARAGRAEPPSGRVTRTPRPPTDACAPLFAHPHGKCAPRTRVDAGEPVWTYIRDGCTLIRDRSWS